MARSQTILVAEDNVIDAWLLRKAWENEQLPHKLRFVHDGQEAIHYLHGDPPYDDRRKFPLPVLLILDLEMPGGDGYDVLKWLGRTPRFSQLPAVVLSGSGMEEDKDRVRRLGAREYYPKPGKAAEFRQVIREICSRWLPRDDSGHSHHIDKAA